MRDQKDLFTIKVLSHIQRLGHQMTQPDKKTQEITSESWVASNATIQGDVTLNSQANIWFGAVLRGDEAPITIGAGTNVQDNAVIHVSKDFPVVLGKHVTVGHGAFCMGAPLITARLLAWVPLCSMALTLAATVSLVLAP